MHNNRILIKALLQSTSPINVLKYSKDTKKKRRIWANFAAYGFVYACVFGYCIVQCYMLGEMNLIDLAPSLCAILLSSLAFMMAFFKSGGYLFNFKDYDMLMALPFDQKEIVRCRFIWMYIKDLPWFICILAAMMIGYGIYARPSLIVYILWTFLALILPVIPMLGASLIGYFTAKIGSKFKRKNLIQTILSFAVILIAFGFRLILNIFARDIQPDQVMQSISDISKSTQSYYLPVRWFSEAVTNLEISSILLLVGISLLVFEVVFTLVGRSYQKINSALKSTSFSGKHIHTKSKKKSLLQTIAYKEYKRMTGSSTYMVNAAFGELLCFIVGIVMLFMDFHAVMDEVFQMGDIPASLVYPAIPFFIYFFIGMVPTTVCSPSLEGKNYWIVQSLPIEKKDLYRGKMLFNMVLTVPFSIFSTACVCFSAGVPFIEAMLYILLGVVLCAFSTAWGCVCGIKYMRLDWENEVEVIKQGSAVAIYLFPNMIVTMLLIAAVIFFGLNMDHILIALIMIVAAGSLALLSYNRVMVLAKKQTYIS